MYRLTAVLLGVLLGAAGCGGTEEGGSVVDLDPAAAPEPVVAPPLAVVRPEQPGSLWDELAGGEPSSTRFIAAEDAEPCPKVRLMDSSGQWAVFRPDQRGYVESGYVTMIVAWSPKHRAGWAAACYVSDCVKEFADNRVRAIGIIEAKPEPELVDATREIAVAQQLALDRIHYDDSGALEELREAVDSDGPWPIAAVFIVDRGMRVRFYRGEFRFALDQMNSLSSAAENIRETVPEGKRIRDYLFRILEEGL
jgi:hypothetical protein